MTKNIKINSNIFRAYDIRGKAMLENGSTDPNKVDLSPESVYLITCGIATYMRRKLNLPCDTMLHVVVGRDCRLTGPTLLDAMIKALKDTNCRIANIDLATSPLVYYAVCKYGFDMGLALTASHNHKNDNGIKIVESGAHSVCGPSLQEILKLVQNKDFEIFHKDAGESYILDTNTEDYIKDLTEKLPLENSRPIKVAVDAGNGVVGEFIGPLLRAAGCEVVELYTDLDGNYPNHEANPEYAENLTELMQTVIDKKCDVGFGFDGDGDRIGVVNEKGEYCNADKIIILLARDILSRLPGSKIVFDVKCSSQVKKEIEGSGGIAITERTGHSFIENRMHAENSPLAGEVSGHVFIAEDYYGYDDAMFAALKIIKILSDQIAKKSGAKFSDLLSDLPTTYTTPEIKVPCPDNKKFEIVEMVTKHFEKNHECITIDGVKIIFSDTTWGLIRSSNTSAYLTLRFEAGSEKDLKEVQLSVGEHLKTYPELDLAWLENIT
ncbi:MAG: phosphomannomutase/phosphoglucomutase [Candidatus Peregrinibacteria bacterium]|nr:phosphomannomutase/phosphoglucomutase [Candidatus Peregrinibacteria bacterium]MDZ4245223.1 phosphomannomutase/phosphoglucomutase [Candidatus Gracilibacteria bacterium]